MLSRLYMIAFGRWSVGLWKVQANPAADSLGIALHLVSMLMTIPLQLAFNTVTPEPPGYTPRALTYTSQDSIRPWGDVSTW